MQCADKSNTLGILVVTDDAGLARELSRFLNTAGYQTLTAAEPRSALAAQTTGRVHVALVDASLASQDDWLLCRALCDSPGGRTNEPSDEPPSSSRRSDRTTKARFVDPHGPFLFLLMHEPDETQLHEALEAGIDDVLLLPVCYGELSARLRAAARVLEFERRASEHGPLDAVTGLCSRPAFLAQVRRHWAAASAASPRGACVVIDLDFFSAVRCSEGNSAANALLVAVSAELNRLRGQTNVAGSLGGDRLAVLLKGATTAIAVEWAQNAARALAEITLQDGALSHPVTASIGLACCDTARSPEQLLEQAIAALAVAKSSGRNRVTRFDELQDEAHETRVQNRLFERTTARDVLIPCHVSVQASDSLAHAADLLRHAALDAIPVVDEGGKLLGLCKRDQSVGPASSSHSDRLVKDAMSPVRGFRQDEGMATLIDYFNQDPLAWAAVVENGRPLGLVNCDSLLALSQPASASRLAAAAHYSETIEYLLVPDLGPDDCGDSP